jgi:hypothetical protein
VQNSFELAQGVRIFQYGKTQRDTIDHPISDSAGESRLDSAHRSATARL